MRARIFVTLKDGVLDPQGEAIRRALGAMGFEDVESVRQGKMLEVDLVEGAHASPEAARERLAAMCEALLANTVIEDYRIELA